MERSRAARLANRAWGRCLPSQGNPAAGSPPKTAGFWVGCGARRGRGGGDGAGAGAQPGCPAAALPSCADAVSSKLQGSNVFTIAKRNVEGQDMLYQSLKLTNGIWVLAELRIQPSNPSFTVRPPAEAAALPAARPACLLLQRVCGGRTPLPCASPLPCTSPAVLLAGKGETRAVLPGRALPPGTGEAPKGRREVPAHQHVSVKIKPVTSCRLPGASLALPMCRRPTAWEQRPVPVSRCPCPVPSPQPVSFGVGRAASP